VEPVNRSLIEEQEEELEKRDEDEIQSKTEPKQSSYQVIAKEKQ